MPPCSLGLRDLHPAHTRLVQPSVRTAGSKPAILEAPRTASGGHGRKTLLRTPDIARRVEPSEASTQNLIEARTHTSITPAGSAGFSSAPSISRYGPLAALRSPIQDYCDRRNETRGLERFCCAETSQLDTRSDYATQKHPRCFKSRTMPRPYMHAPLRQRTSRLTALWVDAWHHCEDQ